MQPGMLPAPSRRQHPPDRSAPWPPRKDVSKLDPVDRAKLHSLSPPSPALKKSTAVWHPGNEAGMQIYVLLGADRKDTHHGAIYIMMHAKCSCRPAI